MQSWFTKNQRGGWGIYLIPVSVCRVTTPPQSNNTTLDIYTTHPPLISCEPSVLETILPSFSKAFLIKSSDIKEKTELWHFDRREPSRLRFVKVFNPSGFGWARLRDLIMRVTL